MPNSIQTSFGLIILSCIAINNGHAANTMKTQEHKLLHIDYVFSHQTPISDEVQATLQQEIEIVFKSYEKVFGIIFPVNIKVFVHKEEFHDEYFAGNYWSGKTRFTALTWVMYEHSQPTLCLYLNPTLLKQKELSPSRLAVIAHEIGHHVFPNKVFDTEGEAFANLFAQNVLRTLQSEGIINNPTALLGMYSAVAASPLKAVLDRYTAINGINSFHKISKELYSNFFISERIKNGCKKDITYLMDKHGRNLYSKLLYFLIPELPDYLFTEAKEGVFVESAYVGSLFEPIEPRYLKPGDKVLGVENIKVKHLSDLKNAVSKISNTRSLSEQKNDISAKVTFEILRQGKIITLNLELRISPYDPDSLQFRKQKFIQLHNISNWKKTSGSYFWMKYKDLCEGDTQLFSWLLDNVVTALKEYHFIDTKLGFYIEASNCTSFCCGAYKITQLVFSQNYHEVFMSVQPLSDPDQGWQLNLSNALVENLLSRLAGFEGHLLSGFYFSVSRDVASKLGFLNPSEVENTDKLIQTFFSYSGLDNVNLPPEIKEQLKSDQIQSASIANVFHKLKSHRSDSVSKIAERALSDCKLKEKDLYGDGRCVNDTCFIRYEHLEDYIRFHFPFDQELLLSVQHLKASEPLTVLPVHFSEN